MSKAVLMSIHPDWCELIASGRKTVEVRKTRPKESAPFKVYIYSTFGTSVITFLWKIDGKIFTSPSADVVKGNPTAYPINSKVVGEFMCKEIDRISRRGMNNNFDYCYLSLKEFGNDDIEVEIRDVKKSCVSKEELNSYSANSPFLYAWHISDLVIYDQPKELSEFLRFCEYDFDEVKCIGCKNISYNDLGQEACDRRISRPPQSWCYVEELK